MHADQRGAPADGTIKVLLVDDHPAVLLRVIRTLTMEFDVVDTLDDGVGVLAAVQRHDPDVVVLDVTMPRMSGFAVAAELARAGCRARIVFLTVHADPDYLRAAFTAGASGYVVKARLGCDLIPAIRAAVAGQRFVSPMSAGGDE